MATKEKVWEKAKTIPGKDPDKYRKDPYGNTLYKDSYGKDTPTGWEKDHIKPKAKGGSDDLRNMQALRTSVNRAKGDSSVKKSRHSK